MGHYEGYLILQVSELSLVGQGRVIKAKFEVMNFFLQMTDVTIRYVNLWHKKVQQICFIFFSSYFLSYVYILINLATVKFIVNYFL